MNGSTMVLERHPADPSIAEDLLLAFQNAAKEGTLVQDAEVRGRSLEILTPHSYNLKDDPLLERLLEQVTPEVETYLGYFSLRDYKTELDSAVITQLPKEGLISSFTRENVLIGPQLVVLWVLEEPQGEATLYFDQQEKTVTLNKNELWFYPDGWSYTHRLSTMKDNLTVVTLRFNIKNL